MDRLLHDVMVRYTIWEIFRKILYANGRPQTRKITNNGVRFAVGRAGTPLATRLSDGRPDPEFNHRGHYAVSLLLFSFWGNVCFRLSGGGRV